MEPVENDGAVAPDGSLWRFRNGMWQGGFPEMEKAERREHAFAVANNWSFKPGAYARRGDG